MDWFLYDNGLRHERIKRIPYRYTKSFKGVRQNPYGFYLIMLPLGIR